MLVCIYVLTVVSYLSGTTDQPPPSKHLHLSSLYVHCSGLYIISVSTVPTIACSHGFNIHKFKTWIFSKGVFDYTKIHSTPQVLIKDFIIKKD